MFRRKYYPCHHAFSRRQSDDGLFLRQTEHSSSHPPPSFLPFARFLGFRVPVFSSLPSSPSPAVPSLPLPSLALPSAPVSLPSGPVSVPRSPALSFVSSSSVSSSARSVVSCGSVVSFSSSVLCPRAAPSLSSPCSLLSSFSLSSSAPQFCLLSESECSDSPYDHDFRMAD